MSETLTLHVAIAKFLSWAQRHLAAKTVKEYRRYLERFARHLGAIAVEDLRAFHLVDWGTTWHRIQAVQRCFNWLVKVEHIPRSPFNTVDRPRPGKRKRIFTRKEFAQLLQSSAKDFRRFLVAMRESLARPQEVRAMRWDEIHNADEKLSLVDALRQGRCYFLQENYKSQERRSDPDEPRVIPISPRLGRLIVRLLQRDNQRGECVFRSKRNRNWTKESVRLRIARARRKLGWKKDHRGEQLVAYSVRHTGGTAYTVAGCRDKMLASIMGHSNTRTTARYQHLQPTDLLNAVDAMRPRHEVKPRPQS